MAWLVRTVLVEQAQSRAELLAALERTLTRVEAPGATAAREWQAPAGAETIARIDEEWLASKDSQVAWDDDLRLADAEVD